MKYSVTKTYGHERGLSCTFRQWRAESHCRYLHGYALAFSFVFEADALDENGWVIDFGALGPLKESLELHFDHKLLMAVDDPVGQTIAGLAGLGIADVMVMPNGVGCEAFARLALKWATEQANILTQGRTIARSCTVSEHPGNSATAYN